MRHSRSQLNALPRFLVPVLLLTGIGACANYQAAYEERLVGSLANQRDVTIDESAAYPGDVLCGRYTSLTGQGFSSVTRDFVVTPSQVLNRATKLETTVYCTPKPREALLDATGLGAWDSNLATAAALRDAMRAIDRSIHGYYTVSNSMPRTLDALVSADDGLQEEVLEDPWGNAYRYEPGLAGRTTPIFDLVSFGADGTPGGTGENADLRFSQLPLLEHVLNVEGL